MLCFTLEKITSLFHPAEGKRDEIFSNDYISFPSSGRALGNVINKLELKYGLLEAADVIDATHMKIKKIVKHCVIERGQS